MLSLAPSCSFMCRIRAPIATIVSFQATNRSPMCQTRIHTRWLGEPMWLAWTAPLTRQPTQPEGAGNVNPSDSVRPCCSFANSKCCLDPITSESRSSRAAVARLASQVELRRAPDVVAADCFPVTSSDRIRRRNSVAPTSDTGQLGKRVVIIASNTVHATNKNDATASNNQNAQWAMARSDSISGSSLTDPERRSRLRPRDRIRIRKIKISQNGPARADREQTRDRDDRIRDRTNFRSKNERLKIRGRTFVSRSRQSDKQWNSQQWARRGRGGEKRSVEGPADDRLLTRRLVRSLLPHRCLRSSNSFPPRNACSLSCNGAAE